MRLTRTRIAALRLLGRIVDRRSEAELERIFSRQPALRALFTGMSRTFDPDVFPGFRGAIEFRMLYPRTGLAPIAWTIDVFGRSAVASRGAPQPPGSGATVSLTAPVAEFLRIALGVVDPAEPILAGRASLSGDLQVGALLPEMFGAPPPR